MKIRVLGALAAALLSAQNAAAGQDPGMVLTGAALLSACSKPDPEWIGFCHGYVQAVYDAAQDQPNAFCAPDELTRATIAGAVVRQLLASEELRTLNASAVVHGTLKAQFPCP